MTKTQAERDAAGAWAAWKVAQARADRLWTVACRLDDRADDGRPADPKRMNALIAALSPKGNR